MEKNHQKFILAAVSGLLLGLAQPGWEIDFGFLVWVGFIPLLVAIRSKKASFIPTFAGGVLYFGIVFRWLWSTYPLDTLGIESKLISFFIVLAIYGLSVVVMAAFWGLFGLVGSFLLKSPEEKSKQLQKWLVFLALPATFCLIEYARAWGMGIFWLGNESLSGPHWTIGNLAYALDESPLALKFASFLGIYGLEFVIILVNYFLFKKLLNPQRKQRLMAAATFLLLLLLLRLDISIPKTAEKDVAFAIIQTNQPTKISYSPSEKLSYFKQQLELLDQVAKNHPRVQLILFPEATDFFTDLSSFLDARQAKEYFSGLFERPALLISGSRVVDQSDQAYSRVFALDSKADIIGFRDKRFLTPWGEFLPYALKLLSPLLPAATETEFEKLRSLNKGENNAPVINFRNQLFTVPIICSEIISPQLVSRQTEKANIIVTMTSSGTFRGNKTIVEQILAIARFRAAENQKPLIMAANAGLSYVIGPDGKVITITQDQKPQILTGAFVPLTQRSWYNKIGDWPMLLVSGLIWGLVAHLRKNDFKT